MNKTKKILLLIIGIIIFSLFFSIGKNIYKDLKTEKRLNTEIQELNSLMKSSNMDELYFEKKLNKIISTGDYYKVEKAYKNYLRDYHSLINNIIDFYNKNNLSDLISIENYKKDGKNFNNSKTTIKNAKNEIERLKKEFDSMKTKEKALSYISNDLNSYYINYYKKIIGDNNQSDKEKLLSDQMNEYITMIDNINKVFDFLSKNKNNWEISNGKIYFSSDKLISEYTKLLENITTIASNIASNQKESKV